MLTGFIDACRAMIRNTKGRKQYTIDRELFYIETINDLRKQNSELLELLKDKRPAYITPAIREIKDYKPIGKVELSSEIIKRLEKKHRGVNEQVSSGTSDTPITD